MFLQSEENGFVSLRQPHKNRVKLEVMYSYFFIDKLQITTDDSMRKKETITSNWNISTVKRGKKQRK